MGQDRLEQQRRYLSIAYIFMFLALFTVIGAAVSYWFANKVAKVQETEVWINAHGLWIVRNLILFAMMVLFAAVWFIPLIFFYWNTYLWVTGCTIAGVVFFSISWLFLLNAFLKGISRFMKNKAVF